MLLRVWIYTIYFWNIYFFGFEVKKKFNVLTLICVTVAITADDYFFHLRKYQQPHLKKPKQKQEKITFKGLLLRFRLLYWITTNLIILHNISILVVNLCYTMPKNFTE